MKVELILKIMRAFYQGLKTAYKAFDNSIYLSLSIVKKYYTEGNFFVLLQAVQNNHHCCPDTSFPLPTRHRETFDFLIKMLQIVTARLQS